MKVNVPMLPSIQGTCLLEMKIYQNFTRYPCSAMPMRPPGLWSETLLNSALKSANSEASIHTSPEQPESDMKPRKMHESYTELVIPFASSPHVLEKYINATGGIRTGKYVTLSQ
jgi:hypothetical protein